MHRIRYILFNKYICLQIYSNSLNISDIFMIFFEFIYPKYEQYSLFILPGNTRCIHLYVVIIYMFNSYHSIY